jgi:hypothetical protein
VSPLLVVALTMLAKPLDGIPEAGVAAADFAPRGWAVESTLAGELNADGTPDLVVVLLQDANGDAERARALVWLHGVPGGKGYTRVTSNVGLAACFQCLGMKGGDAAPELEISEKGVLSVAQWGGSRESYGTTHKFRFQKGAVVLIGLDSGTNDSLTNEGTSVSTNFLTGAVVEEKTDARGATKKTSKKVKPTLTPFSDVKGYGAN